jgi:flagellar hook-associated protein 1
MPIPSFTGLQTALSGLEAAQAELDTTGQNISNESTPGYSRQEVVTQASASLTLPAVSAPTGTGAQLGTGTTITDITRVRDQYLDAQYRTQNSAYNDSSTTYNILNQVQTALGDSDSTGLSTALNNFLTSWSALGTDPSSPAAQQAVVSSGQTVVDTFNQLSSQLSTLEQQVYSSPGSTVPGQWNSLVAYVGDGTSQADGPVANDAAQIASLNTQISQSEAGGQTPNNLLDQRDELIDDLSQYGNVNVVDNTGGTVTVYFGAQGTATPPTIPALVGPGVSDPSNNPQIPAGVDFTDNLTDANAGAGAGGQLGALASLYDASSNTGTLATYGSMLDNIASDLVTAVNGATQSGNPAASFFVPAGTTASSIAVNTASASNPAGFTIGSTPPPFTSAEANAVAGLADGSTEATLNLPNASEDYDSFDTLIGTNVQSANSDQTTQQSLLTAIGNQRESVSGVSLDEEMTNLITYQQAYQASARMMTAIDDTLQTLISMGSSAGM